MISLFFFVFLRSSALASAVAGQFAEWSCRRMGVAQGIFVDNAKTYAQQDKEIEIQRTVPNEN